MSPLPIGDRSSGRRARPPSRPARTRPTTRSAARDRFTAHRVRAVARCLAVALLGAGCGAPMSDPAVTGATDAPAAATSCAAGSILARWSTAVADGATVATLTLGDLRPGEEGTSEATVTGVRILAGRAAVRDGDRVRILAEPGPAGPGVRQAEYPWRPVPGPALLVVRPDRIAGTALPMVGDDVLLGFACTEPDSGLRAEPYTGAVPGEPQRRSGDGLVRVAADEIATALAGG